MKKKWKRWQEDYNSVFHGMKLAIKADARVGGVWWRGYLLLDHRRVTYPLDEPLYRIGY